MLLKSYEWKMIKDLMDDLCVKNEVIDKINKEQEYYIARNIIILLIKFLLNLFEIFPY